MNRLRGVGLIPIGVYARYRRHMKSWLVARDGNDEI